MMPDLRFAATVIGAPPADIIERMAADLVRCSATNEREAIRALVGIYPYGQIVMFIDQALAAAGKSR